MDGDEKLLDRTTMESLVGRNLIVNVYQNGQWGSYRHIPIENGKNITYPIQCP